MPTDAKFQESRLLSTPIRDLGLKIEGTPLEGVIQQFRGELKQGGIERLQPHFYLSTEWGVPFGTISIGIPFYLASPDLTAVHAERVGHIEGATRTDVLRYLRHEMGHVVNYAYKLYDHEEWIKQFGSMTQPYVEEYRPKPFSKRYVRHLPGWYAQKHPDEDWAETFAVWMTPKLDWRTVYAQWPGALAKLEFCNVTMTRLNQQDPLVSMTDLDEAVGDLASSLEEFYRPLAENGEVRLLPGIDGALQAIFENVDEEDPSTTPVPRLPAAELILRLKRDLVDNVYRWTGHFPEPTSQLIRLLAERARQLQQVYPAPREAQVTVALTTLITSLAMNHVFRGSYLS
jgi:hypothetical protein